jgi:hypothetical protein
VRYRIPALIVVLLTAVGAYFAASDGEVRADVRIVLAPPTAAASPAESTAKAAPEVAHTSGGIAVGFVLFEGRLYLVSTSDKAAAARTEQAATPTFACDEKPAADREFEAWLLRNNGGSGTVPQFDEDGSLLAAPHTGTRLHCALQEGSKR